MSTRRSFLARAAAGAAISAAGVAPIAATAQAITVGTPFARLDGALVLSGGGARGAYEAGVVDAMVQAAGVGDRVVLPGVDLVCGSSIGTLNGWFVASGEYAQLRRMWSSIGTDDLFEIKRRYRSIAEPSSGVGTRLFEAVMLERGLSSNVQGVLDGGRVADWIRRHVDVTTPLLVPLVFTVTSLARQTGVVYYRLPPYTSTDKRASAVAAIHGTVGPDVDVREADDAVLHEAIRASAAIPLLFDAVTLTGPDGSTDAFIDGGIADNTPVDVARALAKRVRVVIVDPRDIPPIAHPSGISVGFAAFGIAQRRVTESAMRAAVIESRAKRLLSAPTAEAAAFRNELYDVDIATVRPQHVLPADVPDFDRQDLIDATVAVGRADGGRGFIPYRLR
jgi:predicted acylesterase/phospholipase RssA